MIKKLSVFFPLFNEEGSVERIVKKAVEVLENLRLEYEIILVNDGSKDETASVIDRLSKGNEKIRAIHHPKNLGYGEALKSGFYNAKYDTIVYTDGDGQFDFSQVNMFLEKIEDSDLVIGYRIKRKDPFFRILFAKGWALSLFAFFRLNLKDVDCGFKMIRKKVLEKIPHLESQRGAMINAEIAIKAKKAGFKVAQVGVNHYPRLTGKPTGANFKVIIKSFLDLIKLWWNVKEQKGYFILAILVLILAAFLRLFRISEYMIFLGDEGRDAILVKDILINHHFPLIGPPTSVGNIYLGPLYYYMMAVALAISNLNPVAASVMNALIGVLTVALIYILGKLWFGRLSGLIGAFLYAVSPVTIAYSNFSWNPNPTPFFALLAIFSLYKLKKLGNFLWLIVTGVMIGAAVQMHYLALILIPVAVILWIHEIWYRISKKQKIKNLISGTILGTFAFLLVMSPLFWFDLRHNFLNYRAVVELLSANGPIKADLVKNILRIPSIYTYNLAGRYIGGQNIYLGALLGFIMLLPIIFLRTWSVLALTIWIAVGLLGVSFYQNDVYDHYLGFLNPAPFLLLGSVVCIFKNFKLRIVFIAFIILLGIVNLQKNPLLKSPNNQLKKTQDVARFIIGKSGERPFNFALLSKNNYDSAYQFYLDIYGHKPKQVPFDKTSQLFVVCEDEVCDPTHSPKYELAAFGWSRIDWMEEFEGVKIYKLVPNPSGKP